MLKSELLSFFVSDRLAHNPKVALMIFNSWKTLGLNSSNRFLSLSYSVRALLHNAWHAFIKMLQTFFQKRVRICQDWAKSCMHQCAWTEKFVESFVQTQPSWQSWCCTKKSKNSIWSCHVSLKFTSIGTLKVSQPKSLKVEILWHFWACSTFLCKWNQLSCMTFWWFCGPARIY